MCNIFKITALFVAVLSLSAILCGCSGGNDGNREKRSTSYSSFITDVAGKAIPAYKTVEINNLDSSLFKTDENGRMTYNDPAVGYYSGIDISRYQGEIDWKAVAADGIDFVILRIGGRGYGEKGIMFADDNFETNYNGAIAAGLKVGVYFFSQAVSTAEAKEEAEYMLGLLGNKKIDYPVVFDWELIENEPNARTNGVSNETVTDCANSFCETVKNAGYKPVIYFNRSLGYDQYDLSRINHYDFWIAEYKQAPEFYYNFSMWQYTKQGKVAGIEGDVDLNICFFDYSTEPDTSA